MKRRELQCSPGEQKYLVQWRDLTEGALSVLGLFYLVRVLYCGCFNLIYFVVCMCEFL